MFNADQITHEVLSSVLIHWQRLNATLYKEPSNETTDGLMFSPLAEAVRTLVRVANSEFDRASAEANTVSRVAESYQMLCDALFVTGWEAGEATEAYIKYQITPLFWRSHIGHIMMICKLWLNNDSFITKTDAALLIYGAATETHLTRLNRLVAAGKLTEYIEPSEPNPQRASRLSRVEVEKLNRDGTEMMRIYPR
jgi:hypothetical protein